MLKAVADRLKQDSLLDADYAELATALVRGDAVARGSEAVAVGDGIPNFALTTIAIEGGEPIAVSGAVLEKLGAAVRRSLASVFNNLPAVAAPFTGRAAEEEAIVASLAREGGAAAISALRGIGGVGKTALAVKIGHRVTALFPAAQLLVDLCGTSETPASPRAVMESVIRRFHPEAKLPDDDAAIGEIYRDLLRKNKCFIILDNARDAGQVAPLLPPSPSAAIVTSRPVLPLAGVVATRLDDLPMPEARKLVLDLVGGEPSLAEDELTRLAEACLRHPLSLRVAALFLKTHKGQSVARYVEQIEEDRTRLRLEGQPEHDVVAVLRLSVEQLAADNEALAARWRMLPAFPADFDAEAAAAVWEIGSADEAMDALNTLEGRGLVEATGEDRYRLSDLLRDLAQRDCPKEHAEAAALRHARHFARVLRTADRLFQTGGESLRAGLALFDRERTNIIAGQRVAAAGIDTSKEAAELAADYPDLGAYVLGLRLHPREKTAWAEAALAASRWIRNRPGEGAALGKLGLAYTDLGETRKAIAYYEQALAIAREIGDRHGEGASLRNLGVAYADLGETRKAIDFFERNLAIVREIGDRRAEGASLGNLGLAYSGMGETRKAIEFFERNLAIAREIGDRRAESASLGNLGLAYGDMRETRKAIEFFERNLAIAREIGDIRSEESALGNLGNAYARLGDTRKAIAFFEQNLTIAREIGDRRSEGAALGNLGVAYTLLSEHKEAIQRFELQLEITREIGARRAEGNALGNLGLAYANLGEIKKAIRLYERQLTITREINDPRGEGNALGNLGIALDLLGETKKAIAYYEQQLVIARAIGDRRGEGNALANIGQALLPNDPDAARAKFQDSLDIFNSIHSPRAALIAARLGELEREATKP
jgi:tetratricopeptide (TPR) repeat protein